MQNPNSEIFSIFESLLIAHIGTKVVDSQFHEKSASFYELAFDCFHMLSEKDQDIGEMNPIDCKIAKQQTYKDLEDLKNLLIAMAEEKNTMGKDNLLRGLIDRAESACGDARAFIREDEEEKEDDEDMEETPMKPIYKNKLQGLKKY